MTSDAAVLPEFLALRATAGLPVRVWRWLAHFARTKTQGFVGMVILLVMGGASLLAPVIAPYPYDQADFAARLRAPSASHIFGTDNLGRDLFSRVLFGTRVSMELAFAAVIISKVAATAIALVSGFYGGWIDAVMQRVVDIWLAVPGLVLAITLLGVIGTGFTAVLIVIAILNVPSSARLIGSVVIGVQAETYIDAARTLGAGDMRILLRYILPNVFPVIIYAATVSLGSVIILAASLGFLGFGVPPPEPDLGGMLSGAGLQYMRRMPWMAVWPGIALTLIVFAFNVFGDALRDVLDPRLRGSR